MFRDIITISKKFAICKIDNVINDDLLNLNVIFEEDNKKILGEIEEIISNEVKIKFLGEFLDGKYHDGIIRKPSTKARIRIINSEELAEITNYNDPMSMILGLSPLYNNSPIKININDMWSNHIAIFGDPGSGKTFGVARLIQNLFKMTNFIPFNSVFFIFNNSDEYDYAFKNISNYNFNYHYKMYTSNLEKKEQIIKLPLWLLSVDDYANILDITDYSQIMIIKKMLSYVSLFTRNDDDANKYKNHFIAKAIISIMYSSQVSVRIRDQVFSILATCYTKELNLDVEVEGNGYTREFRKCFDIDNQGQFVEKELITNYMKRFILEDLNWNEEYIPTYFTIDDLEIALNFTLISEGLLLNEKSYNDALALKVKLHMITKTPIRTYFEVDKYIDISEFVSNLILVDNNKRAQIINFVLEDIDDKFSKAIVKVYSRLLFSFIKNLPNRAAMPIHIIIEEAHRYVQEDSDNYILGYNIFERIAREGRKYGVIMDLITKRPTEISESIISQYSNFLIFKINHPSDLEYIEKVVPNVNADITEKLQTLQSGTCIAFGNMMKLPMIVKMQLPNPFPTSSNAQIFDKWMVQWKNN